MTKFKVGDRVRALESSDPGKQFTKGRVYLVTGVCSGIVDVAFDDKGSTRNGWHESMFELVAPEPRFRPGDQVTLTGEVESNDDGYVVLRTAEQNHRVACFESELEPEGVPFDVVAVPDAPFQPGDRVLHLAYRSGPRVVVDYDAERSPDNNLLLRCSDTGREFWSRAESYVLVRYCQHCHQPLPT